MFTFRPLQPNDFKLLTLWRNQSHVAEWWDGPTDLEGIKAQYEPRLAPDCPVRMYIAARGGVPFGRIQYEPTEGWLDSFGPEVANIDFLIGRAKDIGQGLGPRMIDQFVREVVFKDGRFITVVADPDARNTRSVRALGKAGFQKLALREAEGKTFQIVVRYKD